jgi:membrane fusion protein (multidrug efflux system)
MPDGTSVNRQPADPPGSRSGLREVPRPQVDERSEAPRMEQAPDTVQAAPAVPDKPTRRWLRPVLFGLLPLALIAGAYVYVTGGQIVSTDNAYVQADRVGISTDVAGTVVAVEVQNNQAVSRGQVLYRLKQDSYKVALAGAEAQLGTVRNQVLTLKASYKQSLAQIAQAEADLPFYEASFKRQQDLAASAAASKAAFDQAKQDLNSARQKVEVAKAQAGAMLAQLGNDPDQPIEQNPFYLQAQSAVDNARRDLEDTIVKAPFDGVVTNVDAIEVGTYLRAAQPAFSLVSSTQLWIAASPKETELTYVQPGQPVSVSIDTYPGVTWPGTVGSISPASGSSFSLLPAQNTTGNWVKVVQRIPIIVRLGDLSGKPPLRVGMSATIEIDTGHARGMPTLVSDLLSSLGLRHG